jgi:hypothetical protein
LNGRGASGLKAGDFPIILAASWAGGTSTQSAMKNVRFQKGLLEQSLLLSSASVSLSGAYLVNGGTANESTTCVLTAASTT